MNLWDERQRLWAPIPDVGGRRMLLLECPEGETAVQAFSIQAEGPVQADAPWVRVGSQQVEGVIRLLVKPDQAGPAGDYLAMIRLGSSELGVLLRLLPTVPPPPAPRPDQVILQPTAPPVLSTPATRVPPSAGTAQARRQVAETPRPHGSPMLVVLGALLTATILFAFLFDSVRKREPPVEPPGQGSPTAAGQTGTAHPADAPQPPAKSFLQVEVSGPTGTRPLQAVLQLAGGEELDRRSVSGGPISFEVEAGTKYQVHLENDTGASGQAQAAVPSVPGGTIILPLTAPAPSLQERLVDFIENRYYRALEQRDLDAFMACFGFPVDFFGSAAQPEEKLRERYRDLMARWDTIEVETGNYEVLQEENPIRITYDFSVRLSKPNGESEGDRRPKVLTLRPDGDSFRVTGTEDRR